MYSKMFEGACVILNGWKALPLLKILAWINLNAFRLGMIAISLVLFKPFLPFHCGIQVVELVLR